MACVLVTRSTRCGSSEIDVTSGGQTLRYQLPFGLLAEDQVGAALPQQLALSRVRRVRQVGLITRCIQPGKLRARRAAQHAGRHGAAVRRR